MAPVRPSTRKRTSIRSRAERSAKDPRGIYAPPLDAVDGPDSTERDNDVADLGEADFKVSKKDKRTIKHNQLLAKVHEGDIRKQSARSRRRAKKNQLGGSGLTGLGDALPDVDDEEEWEGVEDDQERGMEIDGLRKAGKKQKKGGEKMVLKSAKTRPGATKRKQNMEKSERERFKRNMAELIANAEKKEDAQEGQSGSLHSDRWKALRAFIGGTMEKSKAFLTGTATSSA